MNASTAASATGRVDREESLLVVGRHVPRNDDDNDKSPVTTPSFSSFVGDVMTQLLDDALKLGVTSLPLLRSGNDDENQNNDSNPVELALIQRLTSLYYRNIDIIELYADHHIFSLDMYPPSRRQQIVQAFLSQQQQTTQTVDEAHMPSDNHNNAIALMTGDIDETMTTNTLDSEQHLFIPTQDDVPTPDQLDALAEETGGLRAQLKQLKLERREWLAKCQALEQVQTNTEQVEHAIQKSSQMAETAVDQSVTAVIMGKQGLEQLHARALDLLQELDNQKQPRLMLPGTAEDDVEQQANSNFEKENRSKKLKLGLAPDKVIQQSRTLLQAPPEGMELLRNLIRDSKR